MPFAEVACWCKHDCCHVDTEYDGMVNLGPTRYDCDVCECHEPISAPWDDFAD